MKIRTALASLAVTASALTAAAGIVTAGASGAAASSSAHSATHAPHTLPAWVHWTWASRAARADCHGGPAIIVWVGDSDQSALVCKKNAVIWPS